MHTNSRPDSTTSPECAQHAQQAKRQAISMRTAGRTGKSHEDIPTALLRANHQAVRRHPSRRYVESTLIPRQNGTHTMRSHDATQQATQDANMTRTRYARQAGRHAARPKSVMNVERGNPQACLWEEPLSSFQ